MSQVVPNELVEEVGRARRQAPAGRLCSLSAGSRRPSFRVAGLALIGQAQWDGDYDGARLTFERGIGINSSDIPANLALANIYERGYRKEREQGHNRAELFARSDDAIARVLFSWRWRDNRATYRGAGAESAKQEDVAALELRAGPKLEDRRRIHTSATLRDAYETVMRILADLNHLWPGLARRCSSARLQWSYPRKRRTGKPRLTATSRQHPMRSSSGRFSRNSERCCRLR